MHKSIGNLVGNVIPLCILIYIALVINGIVKPRKSNAFLDSPPGWFKLVLYSSIVIFIILIVLRLAGE